MEDNGAGVDCDQTRGTLPGKRAHAWRCEVEPEHGVCRQRIAVDVEGGDVDLSLLRISRVTFGAPTLGLIGGAGLLTALVPGSMILISAATILAKNVYRPLVPATTDRSTGILARALVPAIALVAVLLTLRGGQAIVSLLLLGYSFVTQLFPAFMMSLGRRPLATAAGAFAGILAGEITVMYISWSGTSVATLLPFAPQFAKDLNVGVVALVVNTAVLVAVTAATRSLTGIVPSDVICA